MLALLSRHTLRTMIFFNINIPSDIDPAAGLATSIHPGLFEFAQYQKLDQQRSGQWRDPREDRGGGGNHDSRTAAARIRTRKTETWKTKTSQPPPSLRYQCNALFETHAHRSGAIAAAVAVRICCSARCYGGLMFGQRLSRSPTDALLNCGRVRAGRRPHL